MHLLNGLAVFTMIAIPAVAQAPQGWFNISPSQPNQAPARAAPLQAPTNPSSGGNSGAGGYSSNSDRDGSGNSALPRDSNDLQRNVQANTNSNG